MGAVGDGILDLGDLLLRQPGDAGQREPPERDGDPEVDDATAVLADLDPGVLRDLAVAGTHARIGARLDGGRGLREPGAHTRLRLALEGVQDRCRLLGGQPALGHEVEHALEWIGHRDTSSSRARRSVASATLISPRSSARRTSRRAASTSAAGADGGAGGVGGCGAAGASGAVGAAGAIEAPESRGCTTRRSPDTERNA